MSTDPEHVDSEGEARDHELEKEPERNCTPTPGTRSAIHSPEPDPPTKPVLQRSRYPLNSRRLTAAHLRAIAEAIGLPTGGSADQIRQCIEGKLQTEREDPNVAVIIREVQTTEQIIALADAEGEFVRTPLLRRGQETGEATSKEPYIILCLGLGPDTHPVERHPMLRLSERQLLGQIDCCQVNCLPLQVHPTG